jgi:ABC-type siderophore export system fused ATPase/permease subunit
MAVVVMMVVVMIAVWAAFMGMMTVFQEMRIERQDPIEIKSATIKHLQISTPHRSL